MPSVSATAVQPPPQMQAAGETILAPGAWPSIVPPNRPFAGGDAGDVGAVLASMMPMLTKSAFAAAGRPA